jgi:hypothetical protein
MSSVYTTNAMSGGISFTQIFAYVLIWNILKFTNVKLKSDLTFSTSFTSIGNTVYDWFGTDTNWVLLIDYLKTVVALIAGISDLSETVSKFNITVFAIFFLCFVIYDKSISTFLTSEYIFDLLNIVLIAMGNEWDTISVYMLKIYYLNPVDILRGILHKLNHY